MTKTHRSRAYVLDSLRAAARGNDLAQHAVDEWQAARLTRRELLRHASVIGLSLAAGARAADALAQAISPPAGAAAQPASSRDKPGGLIRVALLTPAGTVDPLTITDPPSVALINQTSEYLLDDDGERLVLRPSLALSWKSNEKGDVWTFKLRENVRFHDGHPFTAKDVVATFGRLADPKSGSAAVSVLKGVLSKGGTRAVDDHTVEFQLDAPNGNFPYYVSSDNYNAAIIASNASGGYEKHFNGTGPFRLEKFVPKQGATFVRNPDYWGAKALPDRVQFTFYADQQAQILALQGRQADVMPNFTIQGGLGLLNNPEFKVQTIKSSGHRQLHMRCDDGPFKDKRVRQALALSLDRDVIVRGLFRGKASVGNDSPFAPVFPSTNTSVPQRRQNLALAKQLLAQASVPNGFAVTLTTEKFMEIPDYAVVVQNASKAIGIKISLKVETQDQYYGAGAPGKSDWLDAPLGITDYGHRGVPNVFLGAPLLSNGAWNAARFRNPAYDKLYAQYVAALDIGSQKKIAGDIQTLLLDETPLVIPYFYDALIATGTQVSGVRFTAISQLYLDRATLAA